MNILVRFDIISLIIAGIFVSHYSMPDEKYKLKIPEPSGIAYNPNHSSYYIISDDGYLFETDLKGGITKKADYKGLDFEDVVYFDGSIYVVEEMTRNILIFDEEFNKTGVVNIPYQGGRNKGFESICYNPKDQCFYLAIEKDPCKIVKFDNKFRQLNEYPVNFASDISGLTWYSDHIYVLSDEDNTVLCLNPLDMTIKSKIKLKIINPEGICFNDKGSMSIISDNMATLYIYNNGKSK